MRMYVFSLLPGGHTRIKSSWVFTWKLAANQSRASRSLGSRRSSYSRNIRFTCSFVTWPMFPPFGLDNRLSLRGIRQMDFRPRWAHKSTAPEHPASADKRRAARDGDSYDSTEWSG